MNLAHAWKGAPWTPRDWQSDALPRAVRVLDQNPVIRAVTGAGKSILIAEFCALAQGRVVVTTPTVKLVEQLSDTFRARGLEVGRFYTRGKDTHQKVIVCCNDSLASLAELVGPPDLWIADECHKTECDQIKDVVLGPILAGERAADQAWAPTHRIGFTATPYRSNDAEALSLFDVLAFDYGPARAIREGVVVPPKVVHYEGTASDINQACIEMIQGATSVGPGLVDSINITDAQEFADQLNDAGVRAKTVHSRLHDSTVANRLSLLEHGELDCLVHVSMLSEGVDLPWLRWLCCRRPIGSKVLFAQYVGRGLRKHPGKDHCLVFDPQDLFGTLSLDYDAVLSGGVDDDQGSLLPALELDFLVGELASAGVAPQETLKGIPVKVIDPTRSYLRRLQLDFQCQGLISMKLAEADWRQSDMTDVQWRRIHRDRWTIAQDTIPTEHQRALRIAYRVAEKGAMSKGVASDLINVMSVLRHGWPGAGVELEAAG